MPYYEITGMRSHRYPFFGAFGAEDAGCLKKAYDYFVNAILAVKRSILISDDYVRARIRETLGELGSAKFAKLLAAIKTSEAAFVNEMLTRSGVDASDVPALRQSYPVIQAEVLACGGIPAAKVGIISWKEVEAQRQVMNAAYAVVAALTTEVSDRGVVTPEIFNRVSRLSDEVKAINAYTSSTVTDLITLFDRVVKATNDANLLQPQIAGLIPGYKPLSYKPPVVSDAGGTGGAGGILLACGLFVVAYLMLR